MGKRPCMEETEADAREGRRGDGRGQRAAKGEKQGC
jgi:hypothetical protein